jgi:hypothetical protein
MPEHTGISITKTALGEKQPIDDMLDGRDINQWSNPFGQVISYIHASLYEDYSKHDLEAMRQRRGHVGASWIAIGAGTLAILFSLIGVVLEAKGRIWGIVFSQNISQWFWDAELIAFYKIFLFCENARRTLRNILPVGLICKP